jgi:hypothetical protein
VPGVWRGYEVRVQVTDPAPGWKLGARTLPRHCTAIVSKLWRFDSETGRPVAELSTREVAALLRADRDGTRDPDNPFVGVIDWLRLEIESTPELPPQCTAMHAPAGIGTPEQRFPLSSLVTDVAAMVASRNGSFFDGPMGLDYEDTRFEVGRARSRRRGRIAVTTERLEEVARVARKYPRTPTAAVQNHFRVSRGYARRLIKMAEESGLETVGRD